MNAPKKKTFNHQVYEKAYKRLNLSMTERTIFQRLLGFLIRNNKPFPYAATKLAELTGCDKRTVFRCLNRLEHLRLIERIGMGNNRKFMPGSILNKILTTVTNRNKKIQGNNLSTATLCHKKLTNRDTVSYNKTSLSLKPKEGGDFSIEELQEKRWYEKHPEFKVKPEHRHLFDSK